MIGGRDTIFKGLLSRVKRDVRALHDDKEIRDLVHTWFFDDWGWMLIPMFVAFCVFLHLLTEVL